MMTCQLDCKLRCGIFALAAVVLGSVVLADAAEPTTRPAGEAAKAKAYASLRTMLSQVPRELTDGDEKELSSSQGAAVSRWLAANIPSGVMLAYRGEFAGSSGGSQGISVTFRYADISIRGKKVGLRASANFDGRFAPRIKKLKKGKLSRQADIARGKSVRETRTYGTIISVYGKVVRLSIANGELRLFLDDCGFGAIPRSKAPAATTKPATKGSPTTAPATTQPKPPTAADVLEKKAERKLRLADTYLKFDKKAKAIEILKGIVADYPRTNAAKTAAGKLAGL